MSTGFKWHHEPTRARDAARRNTQTQPQPPTDVSGIVRFVCMKCNHEWQGQTGEIVTCPKCKCIRVTSTRTYNRVLPKGNKGSNSQERNFS